MSTEYIKKWIGYLHSVDREMSRIAAEKLGTTGSNSAVPELMKALTNRPSEIRAAAARALGNIGDPTAVPALAELLKDSDSIVSMAAAEALGSIRHVSAVPYLRTVLQQNSTSAHFERTRSHDRGLYVAAVHALEQIGTRDALEAIRRYGGS
ncbi:MAG: HEAT repeat domain-containing protein [Anaerolineae bacterium]